MRVVVVVAAVCLGSGVAWAGPIEDCSRGPGVDGGTVSAFIGGAFSEKDAGCPNPTVHITRSKGPDVKGDVKAFGPESLIVETSEGDVEVPRGEINTVRSFCKLKPHGFETDEKCVERRLQQEHRNVQTRQAQLVTNEMAWFIEKVMFGGGATFCAVGIVSGCLGCVLPLPALGAFSTASDTFPSAQAAAEIVFGLAILAVIPVLWVVGVLGCGSGCALIGGGFFLDDFLRDFISDRRDEGLDVEDPRRKDDPIRFN